MDVEIVFFKQKPLGNSLGKILVKYYQIVLRCELVYHPKNNKAWVRMPEYWVSREEKKRYCYWDNKDISDEFQKVVLNKLFEKYDLDESKVAELFFTSRQKPKIEK